MCYSLNGICCQDNVEPLEPLEANVELVAPRGLWEATVLKIGAGGGRAKKTENLCDILLCVPCVKKTIFELF